MRPYMQQKWHKMAKIHFYRRRANTSSCIWPGRGFSLVGGVSGPLCKWEMGIGVVFGGLGGARRGSSLVGGVWFTV